MAKAATVGKAANGRRKSPPRAKSKPPEKADEASPVQKSSGRIEAFRALARRIAAGEQVVPPILLRGEARRKHLRATLREDHQTRIEERSFGAVEKFKILADSRFKFFRGTALLFYRDMVGSDAHMPTVMALGDVHPKNFGIMPNADGVPIFSVNDFDETIYAPFTWDLKRGGVGFWVASHAVAGHSKKKRRKIVGAFVEGYLDAMGNHARYATEKNDDYRRDNSPKVIQRLFEAAHQERGEWLRDDYLLPNGRGFRTDDELQPITGETEKFQAAVNALAEAKDMKVPERAGELRVKDVCVRHGQGTASLGLPRYYVLIEGPSKDATDDIIIEFKRARRSALEGLTPPSEFDAGSNAERIAHGQSVQLARGDIFYGAVEIEGTSFMTRERAPFRDDIDLDALSYKTWKEYARVCGGVLAQSHALSDDLGQIDYDVEPSIVAAAEPRNLFVRDIVAWVAEAAKRLKTDHEMFREDHALQAFENIDMVYR